MKIAKAPEERAIDSFFKLPQNYPAFSSTPSRFLSGPDQTEVGVHGNKHYSQD